MYKYTYKYNINIININITYIYIYIYNNFKNKPCAKDSLTLLVFSKLEVITLD